MPDFSAIYNITNNTNGKVYVGSALNVSRRKIEHWRDLRGNRHANRKLQCAWNKHGEASFTFSVIERVVDPADLTAREQHWIDALSACSRRGYNLAPKARSMLGFVHTQETRNKMSARQLGKKLSPEHIENTRKGLVGRKMTPEQCEKMRQAKLGKKRGPQSEEHRAKIAAANRGRPLSIEHKAKLAAAKLGTKRPPEAIAKFKATIAAKRAALSPSAITTEMDVH